MAHWQLGYRFQARQWFRKAVDGMEKAKSRDPELLRFRAEAEAVIDTDAVLPDDVVVPSRVAGNGSPYLPRSGDIQ
jgi:hypothetical protein